MVCVDYELFFINDVELEKETFDALPRNKNNKIHSEEPIVLTNKYQEKIVRVFNGVVLEEESFNKKILEEKIKKTIKTKEIKMRNEHFR